VLTEGGTPRPEFVEAPTSERRFLAWICAPFWSVDVEKCLEFTADSFEIHRRRARCMREVGQKDPGTEHREELG